MLETNITVRNVGFTVLEFIERPSYIYSENFSASANIVWPGALCFRSVRPFVRACMDFEWGVQISSE